MRLAAISLLDFSNLRHTQCVVIFSINSLTLRFKNFLLIRLTANFYAFISYLSYKLWPKSAARQIFYSFQTDNPHPFRKTLRPPTSLQHSGFHLHTAPFLLQISHGGNLQFKVIDRGRHFRLPNPILEWIVATQSKSLPHSDESVSLCTQSLIIQMPYHKQNRFT